MNDAVDFEVAVSSREKNVYWKVFAKESGPVFFELLASPDSRVGLLIMSRAKGS